MVFGTCMSSALRCLLDPQRCLVSLKAGKIRQKGNAMLFYVREIVSIVIDDLTPVEVFTSFFDASDFIEEHPELNLYIEAVDEFAPVITAEDINKYASDPNRPTGGIDPRNGFSESELPYVLMFLGWVAEYKSLTVDGPASAQYYDEHFGYEKMLYAYHDAAEAIMNL